MNPQSAIRNPQSEDPEAPLQYQELMGASMLTRAAGWLLISVLAVLSVPAGWWVALKWRCTTQSQCCVCHEITRRAWLPHSADYYQRRRRTSHTWCQSCAAKLGIGL